MALNLEEDWPTITRVLTLYARKRHGGRHVSDDLAAQFAQEAVARIVANGYGEQHVTREKRAYYRLNLIKTIIKNHRQHGSTRLEQLATPNRDDVAARADDALDADRLFAQRELLALVTTRLAKELANDELALAVIELQASEIGVITEQAEILSCTYDEIFNAWRRIRDHAKKIRAEIGLAGAFLYRDPKGEVAAALAKEPTDEELEPHVILDDLTIALTHAVRWMAKHPVK